MDLIRTLPSKTNKAICEYFNISDEELKKRIDENPLVALKDWNELGIDKYYEQTLAHIFGLAGYNGIERMLNAIFPILFFCDLTILDYGAGIGSIPMLLAEDNKVYYYDLPSKTQDFARYLLESNKKKVKFLTKEELTNQKYHVVFFIDVLEHVKNPMKYVKEIYDMIKPGGLFITTGMSFSVNPDTPMHLAENLEYRKEYVDFLKENFKLMYYFQGRKETIFAYIKK